MSAALLEMNIRNTARAKHCQVLLVCVLGLAAFGCGDDASTDNATGTSGTGAGNGTTAGRSGGASGTEGEGTAGTAAAGGRGGSSGAAGMAGRSSTTAGRSGTIAGAGAGGNAGMMSMTEDDAGMPMDAAMPMMPDDDDAGACEPPPNPINTNVFPKCGTDICPAQDSVCLPKDFLEELRISPETTNLLADCADTTRKCVPVALASQAGRALLTKCESVIGAEGRCLSTCVPQVALQASQLPRANCPGAELCAPCYDPRTGEDTGACSQGCDPGPTEPPKRFPQCCGGRGLCVPPALAAEQAPNLNRDTCETGNLCAPAELTDPTYRATTCASLDGAEGRCVSTCVGGAVARQRDRLPTAGCGEDEVCAPCYDPITGEDTGACKVNGDMPQRPAYTFPRCCGNGDAAAGVCVTPELAGDQAGILRQESCARGRLCAPVEKAEDPSFRFPICYGTLGTGACVNECILSPLQGAILAREGCEQAELCAPCALLGAPTGACE